MSYPGFPPNDFALWLSQQVQQGNLTHHQALSTQLSMPQYSMPLSNPLPLSTRPASFPASPQVQIPPANFSANATSTYAPAPFSNPYPVGPNTLQLPAPFPQLPFHQPGTSVPAYGSLESNWRPVRQHSEPVHGGTRPESHLMYPQQVLPPTQGLQQQDHCPFPYANQQVSHNTTLATIHPTLGLCVLVPIGALGTIAPPSPGGWTVTASPRPHRDRQGDRVDRFRRRHSRDLTPYLRQMSPSPSSPLSPYLSSPVSSVATVTPILRHHHRRSRRGTPETGTRRLSSPGRRFRGIGGFTPLRDRDVPRPTIEPSVSSTIATCSQCGAAAGSPYEPFTDGSVPPTPLAGGQEDSVVAQDGSSRGVEGTQGSPAQDSRRFQASVEDIDE